MSLLVTRFGLDCGNVLIEAYSFTKRGCTLVGKMLTFRCCASTSASCTSASGPPVFVEAAVSTCIMVSFALTSYMDAQNASTRCWFFRVEGDLFASRTLPAPNHAAKWSG